MKTILIAVGSEIITGEFVRAFQNSYKLYSCIRGDEALELLQKLRPDILIINLSLPHMMGISVLQHTAYRPPVILALTNYLSDTIVRKAQAAGVGVLIRLPCNKELIATRIAELDKR